MAGRDAGLPDPTSVIILGHSMGGVVARTMLTMPNYQSNSINTIITMSAPHARPPVSFDSQIVSIYDEINDYWRRAYAQQWANNNPLWHVTLVSIAGGGLDTVVPSDYANLESLVPDTHGFTVFTTTIPEVWTSMDHQAILWCDQFRKAIAHALYDVVDVNRSTQTKPRAERMRIFKKWFLTGMEPSADKAAPASEPSTLLTVEDGSSSIMAVGKRLVLRDLGSKGNPEVHLLPVPPVHSSGRQRLTVLTDQKLDMPGELGKLEILLCSVYPLQPGQASSLFAMNMDLSGDSSGSTRLACRTAAPDVIKLPASTPSTRFPFFPPNEPEIPPFSYLQYDVEDMGDNQFVAIVDKAVQPAPGFVLAEFSDQSQWHRTRHISLRRLLAFGIRFTLPAQRPMVTEVKIPSLESSLLAYNLDVNTQACGDSTELFMPLVRQYLSDPYESKYFVNAKSAGVSIHGVAPYLPPPLSRRSVEGGLSFQFWTDPTCDTVMDVRLTVDVLGSLGKLYMRYRTIFASLPLLVVALVLRKQFRTYDSTGTFITFSESLDLCLRRSIPLMLASLTLLSLSAYPSRASSGPPFLHWINGTSTVIDFHQNDLLVGTHDAFFWFIIPLAGIISVGACVVVNYAALLVTQLLGLALSLVSMRPAWVRHDERRRTSSTHVFMPSSPRRRMITTAVLLLLVATFIPYQFAYLVACLVQLTTTVRAQRITSELRSTANLNFYNYVHSIFVLMLWVLPVNLPVLVVWIHNLAVHWLTPFSSHHNVLSIMPFIILVETLTTGKMVPRVNSSLRHVTNLLLFGVALYAAVYGVTYAYMLHYLVNLVALWLVILHSAADRWSLSAVTNLYHGNAEDRKSAKAP
jgi:GPI inositol-deacylase